MAKTDAPRIAVLGAGPIGLEAALHAGTLGLPVLLYERGRVGERKAEPRIAYGLEDLMGDRRMDYAGKRVLLVGSGYSAATTACNLAQLGEEHPETWAIWLARAAGSQPIKRVANDPLRERDRLAVRANMLATRSDANVEFHKQTVIEAIEPAGMDKG